MTCEITSAVVMGRSYFGLESDRYHFLKPIPTVAEQEYTAPGSKKYFCAPANKNYIA